ncbi:MAG TPA: RNA methyltransferase [Acidimicrobiaceae bacterium]|nr:RNA methyltransferase [Acidimicrobiaceae bacterium]
MFATRARWCVTSLTFVATETITAIGDPRVADYVALKGRPVGEVVIVESEPVVTRLIGSGFLPRSFLLTPQRYERMRDVVDATGAPVFLAERDVMEGIVGFDVHRGVMAAVDRPPEPTLDDVLREARRVVVLEGSNDHENIGAIARSARALGVDALVLDPTCADPFARRAVRVSMGELLHLPVVRCRTWPDPLATLAAHGFELWALTPRATANSLFGMGMPDKVALVAGAEGPGLTEATLRNVHYDVRIPMHHDVDSLNIGHALAIAMAAVSPAVDDGSGT